MELWWPLALLRCLFTKGIDPSSIAGNAPESHPTPGVSDGGLGTGVSSISCAIFSCSAAFFDAATAAFSALCLHWPGLILRAGLVHLRLHRRHRYRRTRITPSKATSASMRW